MRVASRRLHYIERGGGANSEACLGNVRDEQERETPAVDVKSEPAEMMKEASKGSVPQKNPQPVAHR
jgi:hypothetical protein